MNKAERQKFADIIENKLSFTNGWAISPEKYRKLCEEAVTLIQARASESSPPQMCGLLHSMPKVYHPCCLVKGHAGDHHLFVPIEIEMPSGAAATAPSAPQGGDNLLNRKVLDDLSEAIKNAPTATHAWGKKVCVMCCGAIIPGQVYVEGRDVFAHHDRSICKLNIAQGAPTATDWMRQAEEIAGLVLGKLKVEGFNQRVQIMFKNDVRKILAKYAGEHAGAAVAEAEEPKAEHPNRAEIRRTYLNEWCAKPGCSARRWAHGSETIDIAHDFVEPR